MKSGKCPKCGATSVRMARNGISDTASHTTMFAHMEVPRGMVVPQQGEARQFACTGCGYLEWWILDPQTIQFIEQSWAPVTPA
jgi:predicted nucleic-acid-binding Zn-ribbon protein